MMGRREDVASRMQCDGSERCNVTSIASAGAECVEVTTNQYNRKEEIHQIIYQWKTMLMSHARLLKLQKKPSYHLPEPPTKPKPSK
eukprot:6417031-Ditylum_brightwellii.AAC.1